MILECHYITYWNNDDGDDGFYFQGMLLADTEQCSIKVLKVVQIHTDSIQFTMNTSDAECRFRVNITGRLENSTNCHQDQENWEVTQCKLVNLEPGTWYHLTIISKTDSNLHNLSLPTSKWCTFGDLHVCFLNFFTCTLVSC